MMEVAVVLGTRPEAIKLAPVTRALQHSPDFTPVMVSVDQHGDLLTQAMTDFALRPDHTLEVRQPDMSLGELTGAITARLSQLFRARRFAAVIVQGDTSTALAAALAAYLDRLPVVHVEAGLRSGDLDNPFPEEAHRRMISTIASLHLAPTDEAARRLIGEGHHADSVLVTGNTVVDALTENRTSVGFDDPRLEQLADDDRPTMIFSMHRRESWGAPMHHFAAAMGELARRRQDIVLVAIRHPNVVVREAMDPLERIGNVIVTDPLPHAAFLRLLGLAHGVMTDSGGVQEEAPSFGTRVLVLRAVTERTEGLRSGVSRMVRGGDSELVADLEAFVDEALDAKSAERPNVRSRRYARSWVTTSAG